MKFYAVSKGKNTGIFKTWSECSSNVTGFSGAVYKSFGTMSEANDYLSIKSTNSSNSTNVIHPQHVTKITVLQKLPSKYKTPVQILRADTYDPTSTIYVDGGQNKLTLPNAYGNVTNNLGEDMLPNNMFCISDMKSKVVELPIGERVCIVVNFHDAVQQNNGAELMAIIAGLRIAINYINNGISVKHIASDSKLVIEYWSLGLVSKETRAKMPAEKYEYILMCKELRTMFECAGGTLIKIPGAANPADNQPAGCHK